jgi:serine/threonine protein kinase
MLPEKIDRYQILSTCGTGGMAVVYKAFDPQRQQEVALKVMMREYLQDQELRLRFKREIEIHSSFRHEAIVPIYAYGQYQGQPYLVMRFMPGGSLQDRMADGKTLPLEDVVDLLRRITPALDAAHAQGIIHRDMKPSNILFDEQGQAFIADFGIARLEEQPNITMMYGNTMIGSPAYMSPEQGQPGMHLNGRCDLYSLGVMVYEMLAGQLPYYDTKPLKLAFDHATKPIPNILAANPKLPQGCKTFIFKALAKKPDDRFASSAEMTEALAAIGHAPQPPVEVVPAVKVEPVAEPVREIPASAEVPAVEEAVAIPAPEPAVQPLQEKVAKKARLPRVPGRLGTSLSDAFRRFLGLSITLPSFQLPTGVNLRTPAILRPLTGWLGLPSTISLSRERVTLLAKLLLILVVILFLCLGLPAVCYVIYRISTAGAASGGLIFPFFSPPYA